MEIIESILMLLAGSGVFMTGMKLMSDGLERSAGKGMQKLFRKISNNRLAGVGVGAGVTAIIQSSAATTVMVIGFVNAGIMSLFQATSIIMGANIGTTITGILISFSALDVGLYASALSLVGVFMMMFSKNDTVKKIGGIMTGLGLIFVGLNMMSSSFKTSPAIANAFTTMFTTIDFPLLLILFGTIFTALIQSSSAATGLIITLVAGSVLDPGLALFVVLGTNIGTCVTALLAAAGASTNAKRASLIHLIFNLIGTTLFAAILWIFNKPIVHILALMAPGAPSFQIALFHVFFNLITTLMLLPFIRQLTKLATLIIRDKKSDPDVLRLYYIDDRILQTPPIAVAQVLKEVSNMAQLARENLDRGFQALIGGSLLERERIHKEEEKINFINKGVARYLIKMAALSLSNSDEKLVGTLHHVISDLERIGDHAENLLDEAVEMAESGFTFSDVALTELKDMYTNVRMLFDQSIAVFENRDIRGLNKVSELEEQVDMLKRLLGNNHIVRLNRGECSVESGTYFYAIITGLERVADHLTNVAFSIKSPSCSQYEAMQKIEKEAAKKREGGRKRSANVTTPVKARSVRVKTKADDNAAQPSDAKLVRAEKAKSVKEKPQPRKNSDGAETPKTPKKSVKTERIIVGKSKTAAKTRKVDNTTVQKIDTEIVESDNTTAEKSRKSE